MSDEFLPGADARKGLTPKTWIGLIVLSVSLGGLLINYGYNKIGRADVSKMIQTESPYGKIKTKLNADHARYEAAILQNAMEHRDMRAVFAEAVGEMKATNAKIDILIGNRRHRQ